MQWNLEKLKDDIAQLYGEEQKGMVSPSIQSIFDRQEFARYHYHQAIDILEDFIKDDLEPESLLKLVLRNRKAEWTDWDECKLKVQANIISCLQCLHVVSDNLGHVIFFGLGLNLEEGSQLKQHEISLKRVYSIVKSGAYREIDSLLEELIEDEEYKYLSAIVNHSKHRSIIEPYININLRKLKGEAHEMWFREFEYGGKPFDKRLVFSFLEPELDRQRLQILKIGNQLNTIVEDQIFGNK